MTAEEIRLAEEWIEEHQHEVPAVVAHAVREVKLSQSEEAK